MDLFKYRHFLKVRVFLLRFNQIMLILNSKIFQSRFLQKPSLKIYIFWKAYALKFWTLVRRACAPNTLVFESSPNVSVTLNKTKTKISISDKKSYRIAFIKNILNG